MHENSIINHDHHGQHTNSQACLAYAIKTPPSAADWLATETFALAKVDLDPDLLCSYEYPVLEMIPSLMNQSMGESSHGGEVYAKCYDERGQPNKRNSKQGLDFVFEKYEEEDGGDVKRDHLDCKILGFCTMRTMMHDGILGHRIMRGSPLKTKCEPRDMPATLAISSKVTALGHGPWTLCFLFLFGRRTLDPLPPEEA
ncbi:hypothetical protein GBA52_000526 [Prunus armeniaca]|nr:hypothetical protein GBA52_000526 [Prunus armeniaca]